MSLHARALLFDLDGVLVDSEEGVTRAWAGWARRHDLDPDDVVVAAQGRRSIDTIRELVPHADVQAEAAVLEDAEVAAAGTTRRHEGAGMVVAALVGVPWAVVTSCTRRLAEARLRAVGLVLPPVAVTAGDVSAGKPDPQGYLAAAARLGVVPADCLVVEDAPAGIAAGKAAGMAVLGVATTHDAALLSAADAVVDDLADVAVTVDGGVAVLTARP